MTAGRRTATANRSNRRGPDWGDGWGLLLLLAWGTGRLDRGVHDLYFATAIPLLLLLLIGGTD